MAETYGYTAGGTIRIADGVFYIERAADHELLNHCKAGNYCYVLTARQLGKSSLMVRTVEKLKDISVRAVSIDLTKLGSTEITINQWYLGLISEITEQLGLKLDYFSWWNEYSHLGPNQRLVRYMSVVLGELKDARLVIFIDEIDTTQALNFAIDDFFAAIRWLYNARAEEVSFRRLAFVLLGVARPTDLINDRVRTPFNIGENIVLNDFTMEEAMPLANGLGFPLNKAPQVLRWIMDWSNGHPYLTQRLCKIVSEKTRHSSNYVWDIDPRTVDLIVEQTFLASSQYEDSNLMFVHDWIATIPDAVAALRLYSRIYAGDPIPDSEFPAIQHLKLAGIVRAEAGLLVIRNKIYKQKFNRKWIEAALRQQLSSTDVASFDVHLVSDYMISDLERRKKVTDESVEVNGSSEFDFPTRLQSTPIIESRKNIEYFQRSITDKPIEEASIASEGAPALTVEGVVVSLKSLTSRSRIASLLHLLPRMRLPRVSELLKRISEVVKFSARDLLKSGHFVDSAWTPGPTDDVMVDTKRWRILKTRTRTIEEEHLRRYPISTLLRGADAKLTVGEIITLSLCGLVLGGAIGYELWGYSLSTAGMALLGVMLPYLHLHSRRAKRLWDFDDQLAETLDIWVAALRSGYSVLQSLQVIVMEAPEPTSSEFWRVIRETQLGLTLEKATQNMLMRIGSKSLKKAVMTINLQREVGGRLAEVLKITSNNIRQQKIVMKKVEDLSRVIDFKVILTVVTLMIAVQWAIFPDYFLLALRTTSGKIAIAISYGLVTIGLLICIRVSFQSRKIQFDILERRTIKRTFVSDFLISMVSLIVVFSLQVPPRVLIWLAGLILCRFTIHISLTRILLLSLILIVIGFYLEHTWQSYFYLDWLRLQYDFMEVGNLEWTITPLVVWFICIGGGFAIILLTAMVANRKGVDPFLSRLAEFAADIHSGITIEEIEHSLPFIQRAILMPMQRVLKRGGTLKQSKSLQGTRFQIALAGKPYNITPLGFWGLRLFLAAGLGCSLAVTGAYSGMPTQLILILEAVGAVIGFLLPKLWLEYIAKNRSIKNLASLADVLDLLVICVEAGLGMDAAVSIVSDKCDNEIAKVLKWVIFNARRGKSQNELIKKLSSRAELEALNALLRLYIYSHRQDIAVGDILRTQSAFIRECLQQRTETELRGLHSQLKVAQNFMLIPSIVIWLLAPVIGTMSG